MKTSLVLLAATLLLAGCNQGNKQLEERVQVLERENTALKAERDAMRAQLGATVAQVTSQQQASREAAAQAAARAYVRQCATALEIIKIDAPDMKLPAALNGRSCDDVSMGANAVKPISGVAYSTIAIGPDSEAYTITVTDASRRSYTQSSP